MQIINMVNSRSLGVREFFVGMVWRNWTMVIVLIVSIALQFVLVEFGGRFMRTTPLTWHQHGLCFALALGSFVWAFLLKLLLPPSCFAEESTSEKRHRKRYEQIE